MQTQQQIIEITTFCKRMGVKHYDVQMELVDHIAGMMDHLQEERPGLDFNEAFQTAIGKFSSHEFRSIVKNKEEQLLKRFRRLWLKELFAFFTFPKITISLLLVTIVIYADKYLDLEDLYNITMYLPITLGIFNLYLYRKEKIFNKFEKDVNNPKVKLPLLVYSVLIVRNNFMLGATYIAYLFLGLVPGLVLSTGLIHYSKLTRHMVYETLYHQIILYPFPIFMIICLAWRKVFIDQIILMRKQYAPAFEN